MLLGCGLAFGFIFLVALVVGFFLGVPIYFGMRYAESPSALFFVLALLPFVVIAYLWRKAIKKNWFRGEKRPEYPYKN